MVLRKTERRAQHGQRSGRRRRGRTVRHAPGSRRFRRKLYTNTARKPPIRRRTRAKAAGRMSARATGCVRMAIPHGRPKENLQPPFRFPDQPAVRDDGKPEWGRNAIQIHHVHASTQPLGQIRGDAARGSARPWRLVPRPRRTAGPASHPGCASPRASDPNGMSGATSPRWTKYVAIIGDHPTPAPAPIHRLLPQAYRQPSCERVHSGRWATHRKRSLSLCNGSRLTSPRARTSRPAASHS